AGWVGPDVVDPSVAVMAPVAVASTPSGAIELSVSAGNTVTDNNVIALHDDTTTRQWLQPNGTWGSFNWQNAVLDAPGGTAVNWTHDVTLPPGNYGFATRVTDTSGNQTRAPWRAFGAS
ncbi:MAG: hypothetical protein DWP92_00835, partial [Armatimonadetes bacterium]